jgi:hypothetical protein
MLLWRDDLSGAISGWDQPGYCKQLDFMDALIAMISRRKPDGIIDSQFKGETSTPPAVNRVGHPSSPVIRHM